MRIVVLDRSPYGNAADARSDSLLVAAARDQGHEAEIVTLGRGAPAPRIVADVVLPRADLRSTDDLASFARVVEGVEASSLRCFPSSASLVAAEDKRRTHDALAHAGLPSVATLVVPSSPDGQVLATARLPEFPLVVKEPVGWGGRGVTVCPDAGALRSALASAQARLPGGTVLVQPFVQHRRGLTAQVAGGRVVGAFATTALATRDRSDARPSYEDVPLDDVTASVALRAVAACGLAGGSVDFLDAADGSRPVLEVNAMPGLDPDDAGDRAFAEAIVRAVTGAA